VKSTCAGHNQGPKRPAFQKVDPQGSSTCLRQLPKYPEPIVLDLHNRRDSLQVKREMSIIGVWKMTDRSTSPATTSASAIGESAPRFFRARSTLIVRAGILASLLALEYILYFFTHDPEPFRYFVGRVAVSYGAFFFVIGYPRVRSKFRFLLDDSAFAPVSARLLCLHTFAIVTFLVAGARALRPLPGPWIVDIVWLFSGAGAILYAAIAFIPPKVWYEFFRITGNLWIYSMAAALAASALVPVLWSAWTSSDAEFGVSLTFWLVRLALSWFIPAVVSDPPTHVVGTNQFAVAIAGSCSGWEGLSLAAIFTAISLWLLRREYRFPTAFILVPASMALAFALNAARIAALILIGHYGFPDVAVGGFHSQAGWIAFSCVASAVSLIGPRIKYLRAQTPGNHSLSGAALQNPAIPFLLPFAAILASGMISLALSGGFEWLYPVRFFVAAAAIWFCRRDYENFHWRFDWFPLLAGTIVFAVWLALDRGSHPENGIATGLAGMSPSGRIVWIFFRALAAITTVPLAEELAFRGFLFRRIVSVEFESVAFARFSYPAFVGSSLAFGLLHGDRWIAGTLAGMGYAAAMIRRGRISDAITAHVVTNALLAAWVLYSGQWYYW
jgi:exosortase E/protease (VPEID-CTERM system)